MSDQGATNHVFGVEQRSARQPHKLKVAGSNPAPVPNHEPGAPHSPDTAGHPRTEGERSSTPGVPALSRSPAVSRLTVEHIQRKVARHFGVSKADIVSRERMWRVAHPRQAAMALSRELTGRSLHSLGRQFGGLDHTTVVHAVKAVASRCERDEDYEADVSHLRRELIEDAKAGRVQRHFVTGPLVVRVSQEARP